MSTRHNFSKKDIAELAQRVCGICSNPQCSTPCYGPSETQDKSVTIGEAAHITAASKGGPRYDPKLSEKERSSIKNGIWLCAKCATQIDKDENKYSKEELVQWKTKAENRATRALETGKLAKTTLADTLAIAFIQDRVPFPKNLPNNPHKITVKKIKAHRNLRDLQIPITGNTKLDRQLNENNLCLITISCQNLGTDIDEDIQVEIKFPVGALLDVSIPNPERVNKMEGGGKNSTFAKFYLKNLLPNETQSINIIARRDIPFDLELWSAQEGPSKETFVMKIDYNLEKT